MSILPTNNYKTPPASHYESFLAESPHEVSNQSIPNKAQPHLILHFDMNKTLIASDKAGNKTAKDVICAEIADQVTGLWGDPRLSEPINYTTYVKHYLLPNLSNSGEIKAEQGNQISNVFQVLQEMNHPDYLEMRKTYDRAIALLENQETQIFPSFYKLIEFLRKEEIPYTLVIRTFGVEAGEIAKELNERFGDRFLIDFRVMKQGDLQGSESNLYKLVANTDHHLVIQDDWGWWFGHGRDWKYGKPFPVDLTDPQHISLFFDDNAKPYPLFPEENIVFPYDAASGKPIPPVDLINQNRLFPVEMIHALCDENYYIRFVEKALSHEDFAEQAAVIR